ncbi:choice-of-anchor D domain-containing protein [Hymenobacter sp. BT175]|uniref:beta strand repeat-containing protein n=1 Tax=Hymenobacter translucens TaxID=2886507 RepID=UPI001D0E052C|nr:choice-of-anchor D domain-containing protein [Hymenobacter translucens]MCC2546661.1 choice-of-anchor D domain-containing protein [Hymenobacter translucens]
MAVDDITITANAGVAPVNAAPTVTTTTPPSSVGTTTATIAGNITSLGVPTASSSYGFLYSTSATTAAALVLGGTGVAANEVGTTGATTGAYSANLTSLTANTIYYYRAYATNSTGTGYGSVESFTTLSASDNTPPVFAAGSPSASVITSTGFTLSSTINETGITYFVVLASGATAPTAAEVKAGTASGGGALAANLKGSITNTAANTAATAAISGLTGSTTYDVYVVAEDGIPNLQTAPVKVTVTTLAPAPVASGFTPANGPVGTVITISGTNLSTITGVTVGGTAATNVSASATTVTATVAAGTVTGAVVLSDGTTTYPVPGGNFTVTTAPVVSTTAATLVTPTTARTGGNVTADGGATITGRGVVYGTSPNPRLGGTGVLSQTATGTTGSFTSNLSGLTPSTTYFVAAYATNSVGTTYGDDQTFMTLAPTITAAPTALSGFSTSAGTASGEQTYVLTGNGVTDPILVTAPAGFEVSLTTGTGFGSSVSAPAAGGTVYVRIAASATAGSPSGTITNVAGAASADVTVSGTVFPTGSSACISESFSSIGSSSSTAIAPPGWTFTGVTSYQTSSSSGAALPAVRFDNTNDQVITPTVTNPVQLSFFILGNSTDAVSSFLVEGFDGTTGTYKTIATIVPVPTARANGNYTFSSATGANFSDFTNFRFTYTKSAGNLSFDDVTVICAPITGPEINLQQNSVNIASGTGTYAFATTNVGNTTTATFTIQNLGSQDVTLGTVAFDAVTPGDASQFSITQPASTTIAPGTSVTFTVSFSPTTAGNKTTTISIPNNDSNENPYTFTLTGTADPVATAAVFYTKATGDLNLLSTYGDNPDGSGNSPVDFTSAGKTYIVTGTGRTLSGNLTVSGTNSKLVLDANAQLIIPTGFSYTGTLDLGAGSTLTVLNTAATPAYTLGTVDITSTVDFAQAGTFVVPGIGVTGYGNLKLTNGTKTLASGTIVVRGNFTVDNVSGFSGAGSPFSTLNLGGNFTELGTVTYGLTANGFTLVLTNTTTPQTLTGNGNPINLFRLTTNTGTATAATAVVLSTTGGSTNLTLGNASAGGLVLGNFTTLALNSNTLTIIGGGNVGSSTLNGTIINAADGTVVINKTDNGSAGTLRVTGTLGTLTLDTFEDTDELALGTALVVNNLNLTQGILALTGRVLTLNGTVVNGTGQLRGSSVSGLALTGTGSIPTLNFVNSAAATSLATLVLNRDVNTLVALANTLTVADVTLTRGSLIFTPATRLVVTGTLTGGNVNSFVNALTLPTPASTTAATLNFPLGSALGFYRPLTFALTQSSATAATGYTARIVEQSARARGANAPLTRVSAIRYFTVGKETGGATFTDGIVTLTFGEEDEVNEQATLRLATSTGSSAAFTDLGAPTINGTFPATGFATGTIGAPTTTLGDFALASTSAVAGVNPLPVSLISFTARLEKTGVRVRWATASEKNNARFEVQRSQDGREFQTIATEQGQGTTSAAHTYTTLDREPLAGTSYYRLRQVDFDGKASLSDIVAVQNTTGEVVLYPNPTADKLTFQTSATSTVRYRVLSSLGRVLLQGQTDGGSATLDVSKLPAGIYHLELTSGGGRVVRKFSKTN